jgi:hypothetical protein
LRRQYKSDSEIAQDGTSDLSSSRHQNNLREFRAGKHGKPAGELASDLQAEPAPGCSHQTYCAPILKD